MNRSDVLLVGSIGLVAGHLLLPDTLGLVGALFHAGSGWLHLGVLGLGVGVALGGGRRWLALPSLAFLLWTGSPGARSSTTASWTVATHNAYAGSPSPERLAERWTAVDVDLLAVQELTPGFAARMAQPDLLARFPHQFTRPARGPRGMGIFSRHPLTVVSETDAWVRAETHGTVVYNVHSYAPFSVERSQIRSRQLQALAVAVSAEVLPVVVLGDLNAGPTSPAVRLLRANAGLLDALTTCRRGWSATWSRPPLPTLLRLDHVLSTARCSTAEVLPRWSSDHAPVRVVLKR